VDSGVDRHHSSVATTKPVQPHTQIQLTSNAESKMIVDRPRTHQFSPQSRRFRFRLLQELRRRHCLEAKKCLAVVVFALGISGFPMLINSFPVASFSSPRCPSNRQTNPFSPRAPPSLLVAAARGFGKKGEDSESESLAWLDRFRADCPADRDSIRRFEPSLVDEQDDANVWVAVYRSFNNSPSVFVNDSFLSAMRLATTDSSFANPSRQPHPMVEVGASSNSGSSVPWVTTPVAVARLRQSSQDSNVAFTLDSLRCILPKEKLDASCDGGSEHTEALAVAIDTLLLHYLSRAVNDRDANGTRQYPRRFDGVIRAKATLVSGPLLENRGFQPVTCLTSDMATHVSSSDQCLQQYATRSVRLRQEGDGGDKSSAPSPGAQRRALTIVSLLGQIDREADVDAIASNKISSSEDSDEDPWAAFKRYQS
jgi:hypothetical protein